jgi:hypothetical protein
MLPPRRSQLLGPPGTGVRGGPPALGAPRSLFARQDPLGRGQKPVRGGPIVCVVFIKYMRDAAPSQTPHTPNTPRRGRRLPPEPGPPGQRSARRHASDSHSVAGGPGSMRSRRITIAVRHWSSEESIHTWKYCKQHLLQVGGAAGAGQGGRGARGGRRGRRAPRAPRGRAPHARRQPRAAQAGRGAAGPPRGPRRRGRAAKGLGPRGARGGGRSAAGVAAAAASLLPARARTRPLTARRPTSLPQPKDGTAWSDHLTLVHVTASSKSGKGEGRPGKGERDKDKEREAWDSGGPTIPDVTTAVAPYKCSIQQLEVGDKVRAAARCGWGGETAVGPGAGRRQQSSPPRSLPAAHCDRRPPHHRTTTRPRTMPPRRSWTMSTRRAWTSWCWVSPRGEGWVAGRGREGSTRQRCA